jgi:hypothetical protein
MQANFGKPISFCRCSRTRQWLEMGRHQDLAARLLISLARIFVGVHTRERAMTDARGSFFEGVSAARAPSVAHTLQPRWRPGMLRLAVASAHITIRCNKFSTATELGVWPLETAVLRQNPRIMLTRTVSGTAGCTCTSSTPPSGSPGGVTRSSSRYHSPRRRAGCRPARSDKGLQDLIPALGVEERWPRTARSCSRRARAPK